MKASGGTEEKTARVRIIIPDTGDKYDSISRFIATHSERCRTAIEVFEGFAPSDEVIESSPNGEFREEEERALAVKIFFFVAIVVH